MAGFSEQEQRMRFNIDSAGSYASVPSEQAPPRVSIKAPATLVPVNTIHCKDQHTAFITLELKEFFDRLLNIMDRHGTYDQKLFLRKLIDALMHQQLRVNEFVLNLGKIFNDITTSELEQKLQSEISMCRLIPNTFTPVEPHVPITLFENEANIINFFRERNISLENISYRDLAHTLGNAFLSLNTKPSTVRNAVSTNIDSAPSIPATPAASARPCLLPELPVLGAQTSSNIPFVLGAPTARTTPAAPAAPTVRTAPAAPTVRTTPAAPAKRAMRPLRPILPAPPAPIIPVSQFLVEANKILEDKPVSRQESRYEREIPKPKRQKVDAPVSRISFATQPASAANTLARTISIEAAAATLVAFGHAKSDDDDEQAFDYS